MTARSGAGGAACSIRCGCLASRSWSCSAAAALTRGSPRPPAAIYVMHADGGGLQQLTAEAGNDLEPAWSPDGRRIAFARSPRTQGVGESDLYVVEVDGGNETRLTSGPAADADPAWSPDGQRVAFTRYANDAGTIMVVNVDGSGIRPLTDIGAGAMPSWSPTVASSPSCPRLALTVRSRSWRRTARAGGLPRAMAASRRGMRLRGRDPAAHSQGGRRIKV